MMMIIAGKMTEYCAFECKNRIDNGLYRPPYTDSLQSYIEITCGKDLQENEIKSKMKFSVGLLYGEINIASTHQYSELI